QQVTDYGYARVPNGTGNFVIQQATFNANNNLSTGIANEIAATASMTAFPNPANSLVTIRMNEASGKQLEIFDQVGQKVFESIGKSVVSFNTENLHSGVYIVRCGLISQKLMVQH
ncbi:MAG TPA: T9SS type A sorting domain-containing protein, partial [Bacteroidia bacterium]|nr:T9SS type A sorting domain-containing protein [Bacteroidia bacterium]